MPIVKPKPDEKQTEFISRCIKNEINNGKEQKQSAAICYSIWKNRNKKK